MSIAMVFFRIPDTISMMNNCIPEQQKSSVLSSTLLFYYPSTIHQIMEELNP